MKNFFSIQTYLYLLGYRDDISIGKCFHYGIHTQKDLKIARIYYLHAIKNKKYAVFHQLSLLSQDEGRIGESFYDDPEKVENFNKNVLYHFDFIRYKLIIGKFCQIATNVRFIRIGYDAIIMPRVKIGDDAIIASRAVVTKDIEPYSIVGGNPAQLSRKRFDNETIHRVINLAWWNWSFEKITEKAKIIDEHSRPCLGHSTCQKNTNN